MLDIAQPVKPGGGCYMMAGQSTPQRISGATAITIQASKVATISLSRFLRVGKAGMTTIMLTLAPHGMAIVDGK